MRLAPEFIKECFYLDDSTGKVMWKARPRHHFMSDRKMELWNAKFPGTVAGAVSKGYQRVCFTNGQIYCHVASWILAYGEYPDLPSLDHKDGDRQNNRIGNLRECTIFQNNQNSLRAVGATGIKGVYLKDGAFVAQIHANGKKIHLGRHKTAEAAREAHRAAVEKYHGEFSVLGKRLAHGEKAQ